MAEAMRQTVAGMLKGIERYIFVSAYYDIADTSKNYQELIVSEQFIQ
jgi:hypothetical protein